MKGRNCVFKLGIPSGHIVSGEVCTFQNSQKIESMEYNNTKYSRKIESMEYNNTKYSRKMESMEYNNTKWAWALPSSAEAGFSWFGLANFLIVFIP